MAEVLTLLERIQRNQDDIIRRLVVRSMQLLAVCVCVCVCVCVAIEGHLSRSTKSQECTPSGWGGDHPSLRLLTISRLPHKFRQCYLIQ